jgi:hypothetical protein
MQLVQRAFPCRIPLEEPSEITGGNEQAMKEWKYAWCKLKVVTMLLHDEK